MSFFDRDVRYLVGDPWHPTKPIMIYCPNPAHEDQNASYAVYSNGGHCFGCGFKERAIDLIHRLGADVSDVPLVGEIKIAAPKKTKQSTDDWKMQTRLWHDVLMSYRSDRVAYLTDQRGLSERTINTFLVGHTGSHFSIPLWDENGDLAGYKLRYDPEYSDPLTKNPAKYLNRVGQEPVIFSPSALDPLPPDAPGWWVAEGEFDALLLHQLGYRAVTIGSVQQADRLVPWLLELQPREVVLALDGDAEGKKAQKKLSDELYSRVDQLYQLEPPEAGMDITDLVLSGKDIESYLV